MGGTLSQKLSAHEFLLVYATTEKIGGQEKLVSTGTPYTWDTNNGVLVVYDEHGCPWIKRNGDIPDTAELFGGQPNFRGAYVPHSNDGGEFITKILHAYSPKAPSVDRRLHALVQVVERIMATAQQIDVSSSGRLAMGHLQNQIANLYELAKLIYRAKTEADFQEALKQL